MVFSFFLANSVINTLSIIDWFVVSKFRRAFFAFNNKQGYPVHQISWTFNSVVATTTGGEGDDQWRHRDDITWANDTNDFWWIWYFLDNYRHAWKFSILRIESRSAFINENFSISRDFCEYITTKYWSIAPKSDARQAGAATEGIVSYAANAIWNSDTRQVEASVEGKSSNASNSIRNRDVRQVGALRECISPDAGDTVWNGNVRQVGAVIESPIPDAGNAIRNRNARQVGTGSKDPHPDTGNTVRDCNICQTGASQKSRIPDGGDTVRDDDACQTCAVHKGLYPDASDAIWNVNTRQAFAFLKGLFSDTYEFTVFTEGDASQASAVS